MSDKIKVYIVEDDEFIAKDLKNCLENQGYYVSGISDSGEAAILNILKIKPDFILMDINLKGKMDGIEAATEIAKHQNIPLAFLTGNTDDESIQRAKLTLPYGYIVKPYEPSEIHSTIQLTLFRISKDNKELDEDFQFDNTQQEDQAILQFLSKIEMFKEIPIINLTSLSKGIHIKLIDAGTILRLADANNFAGFIVLSGRVSILKSTIDGKELIVSLLGAGDIFGTFFLLNECCIARTQIDSKILWIPKSIFESFRIMVPNFDTFILSSITKRLVLAYDLASALAHSQVEYRIINTILTLLPRLGHPTSSIDKSIITNTRLFMTRRELADLTGTTPETAIRITKNLEREGCLDLSRPGIIKVIDIETLKSMIT